MAGRWRLMATLLALAALATLAAPGAASADAGDLEVMTATAESRFPDGILFRITAESAAIIDEVRVFFKKADQTRQRAYRSIDVEPGPTVAGETLLPASGGADYIPPGTKISYHFEVRDQAGNVIRTDETEFVYIDNRFEWLTVSDGLITVYYYGEYVQARAQIILDAAKETMDNMVKVLGIAPTDPLRIVSYNNYRHMSMALPFRSQAVSEELRTQGLAFTDERVLLVHGFDPTVTGTVSHEFTHLLVAEAAGGTSAAVPWWLNEGLAEYGNIDQTDDYDAALRYGIYTRRIRPLWYLNTSPGDPDGIIIAYGQGKSAVNYMVQQWGEPRLSQLFSALRQTNDIDAALMQVYGVDQHGIDTAWRQSLGLDPLPAPEELESQMRASAQSADATPEPGGAESEPAPPQESTAAPRPADGATPEPSPSGESAGGDGAASGGCAAPAKGAAQAPAGLGMLALMSGPLALAGLPFLRRRVRS